MARQEQAPRKPSKASILGQLEAAMASESWPILPPQPDPLKTESRQTREQMIESWTKIIDRELEDMI